MDAEGHDSDPVREVVRCPVCDGEFVQTKVRGVVIDVCEAHGIWLDAGELNAILEKEKRNRSVHEELGGEACAARR